MDYNFFDFNLGLVSDFGCSLVNEGNLVSEVNLVIKGNLMNHYCLFITADPIPVTVSDPVLINRIFTNVPLDSNIARLLKLTEVAGGGNVVDLSNVVREGMLSNAVNGNSDNNNNEVEVTVKPNNYNYWLIGGFVVLCLCIVVVGLFLSVKVKMDEADELARIEADRVEADRVAKNLIKERLAFQKWESEFRWNIGKIKI
jgi:hypothetical protein